MCRYCIPCTRTYTSVCACRRACIGRIPYSLDPGSILSLVILKNRHSHRALRKLGDVDPTAHGLQWQDVGTTEPTEGRRLANAKLQDALQKLKGDVMQFVQEDVATFGFTDLRGTDFIEAGGRYWQPTASTHKGTLIEIKQRQQRLHSQYGIALVGWPLKPGCHLGCNTDPLVYPDVRVQVKSAHSTAREHILL